MWTGSIVIINTTSVYFTLTPAAAVHMSQCDQIQHYQVFKLWYFFCAAAEAAGPQRGQGGIHCDGRNIHGFVRGVQRPLHQEPSRRFVWTHLEQRDGGRQVLKHFSCCSHFALCYTNVCGELGL